MKRFLQQRETRPMLPATVSCSAASVASQLRRLCGFVWSMRHTSTCKYESSCPSGLTTSNGLVAWADTMRCTSQNPNVLPTVITSSDVGPLWIRSNERLPGEEMKEQWARDQLQGGYAMAPLANSKGVGHRFQTTTGH